MVLVKSCKKEGSQQDFVYKDPEDSTEFVLTEGYKQWNTKTTLNNINIISWFNEMTFQTGSSSSDYMEIKCKCI